MEQETQTQDITAVLAEVANDVVGELELDRLLPRVLETTMRTLNAEVCSIFLRKEDNPNIIKCVAGSGFAKNIVDIAEYAIGEGFTGTVALGNTFNIKNREQLRSLAAENQWRVKFDKQQWMQSGGVSQYRNGIALPLKIKDQILGVIKVENKEETQGSFFTETDEVIFKTIANVVALAIENAKSHQKAEAQSKAISQALSDVASAVVGQLSRQELLDKIIETIMRTLDAEVCSIFLIREDNPNILTCVAGSGFAKNIVNVAEYEIGEGLTGTVAKGEASFHIRSRAELEEEIQARRWKGKWDHINFKSPSGTAEFRNLLAYPLKISDKILGVIKVENKVGGDFTNQDETVFQIIANVIALTIEKAHLQEQTEKLLKTISSKAAHRINNQVTNYDAIEVFLRDEISEIPSSPTQKRILSLVDRLHGNTVDLKRMIGEFRGYGKPLQLKKEIANLNEIIDSEVQQFKRDNQTVGVNLTLDPNIPNFYLDKALLSENIKELLRNSKRAIEAAKQNSGKVEICTVFYKADNISKKRSEVRIIIKDNGPGVPEGFPIFNPFHSTHPQGTGLGLATVKESVEVHGGKVELLRNSGKGACFEITIPVLEQ